MKCEEAISLIHEYLDGELNEAETKRLKQHLSVCADCKVEMDEFIFTESLIKSVPIPKASSDLSDKILSAIPKHKKSRRLSWFQMARNHPAITAAAIFLFMMLLSMFTLNDRGHELVIRGSDSYELEIRGNQVIVPEGKTINGNLVVENGTLQVDGKVEGNITVIDGSFQMASTAAVTGKVTRINQWIDRIWFAIYDLFTIEK